MDAHLAHFDREANALGLGHVKSPAMTVSTPPEPCDRPRARPGSHCDDIHPAGRAKMRR